MPNDCSNELVIKGTKQTLDKICEKHIKSERYGSSLDFDTILPYPQECKEADRKAGEEAKMESVFSDIGYRWRVDNWGTKWSSYNGDHRFFSDTELYLTFDTAWSPPEPVVIELAKMYPDAEFILDYREEGMNFYGRMVCKDGAVTEAWCKEIEEDEDSENEEWAEIVDA